MREINKNTLFECIALLAGMLRSASVHKQMIVATQSSNLVSEFEPENLIVCERIHGLTSFQRSNLEYLKEWLQDFFSVKFLSISLETRICF